MIHTYIQKIIYLPTFSHTLAQERKEVSLPFFIISSRPQRNRGGGGGRRLHVALMRVSMFRWRDRGYGHRCGFWALSLSPLWRFWPQILPHTVVLLSQKKGYFIKFELFSSFRGQEFDQRNNCKTKRSIKCCTYSCNRYPLPHPVCPNIDTCIRNPLQPHAVWSNKMPVGVGGEFLLMYLRLFLPKFNCTWATYRYATPANNASCNVFYI